MKRLSFSVISMNVAGKRMTVLYQPLQPLKKLPRAFLRDTLNNNHELGSQSPRVGYIQEK